VNIATLRKEDFADVTHCLRSFCYSQAPAKRAGKSAFDETLRDLSHFGLSLSHIDDSCLIPLVTGIEDEIVNAEDPPFGWLRKQILTDRSACIQKTWEVKAR